MKPAPVQQAGFPTDIALAVLAADTPPHGRCLASLQPGRRHGSGRARAERAGHLPGGRGGEPSTSRSLPWFASARRPALVWLCDHGWPAGRLAGWLGRQVCKLVSGLDNQGNLPS